MDFLTADTTLVALFGALGGIALGLAARLGRFCSLGAIEDALYGNSYERLRMWVLAVGVAIVGCFSLIGLGFIDAGSAFFLTQPFSLAASIIGGLIFGYGMALAGTCGFGAIARLGGGDLRSFVIVLVMGVSSYVALSGPLASLRVWAFPRTGSLEAPSGIAHGLGDLFGLSPVFIGLFIGILVCIAALWGGALRQKGASISSADGQAHLGSQRLALAAYRSSHIHFQRLLVKQCSLPCSRPASHLALVLVQSLGFGSVRLLAVRSKGISAGKPARTRASCAVKF